MMTRSRNVWIALAAANAVIAVAGGAFGAHALRERLPEAALHSFEVGVRYQMYHALALLAVGVILERRTDRLVRAAAILFLLGIPLFSGSLYGLSLSRLGELNVNWLGPITPIGGACFMAGWILLLIAGMRK